MAVKTAIPRLAAVEAYPQRRHPPHPQPMLITKARAPAGSRSTLNRVICWSSYRDLARHRQE
jgi:hypothetical protein